jgi:hypothetical protein
MLSTDGMSGGNLGQKYWQLKEYSPSKTMLPQILMKFERQFYE